MAREDAKPRKPCCLVSEILEESGIDREKARQLRRQVLEGVMLFCQWQLARMEERPSAAGRRRKGRKVAVE